jgi:hypothetical protein
MSTLLAPAAGQAINPCCLLLMLTVAPPEILPYALNQRMVELCKD